MQRPTITVLRIRSPADAHVIFHAVSLNLLPIVSRRLDTEERRSISSGCVFVWEERGSNAEATGLGIERWTDSIRWGPSRVKDDFLFYHEKEPEPTELELLSGSNGMQQSVGRGCFRENLIKQTYSVFVETPRGRRKWHLIAYFTQDSLEYLRTIDDIPALSNLHVPPGKYITARTGKPRRSTAETLAPLEYLENIPPPRRHPVDEEALMSFTAAT
ncbi:hypothetical protein Moror_16480 [Moniliophthora roreri MCA 2997]|uniref:Gti1/Pac2 family-domain-containing protein n=1 Tax=Moniliophthora roreri (strain MCA 2997) TaxID=1381753 RepID=V2YGR6_MONRO|nr:hypothetical protein Moror_16480 [Moniliophthora roreri MCA 2997]